MYPLKMIYSTKEEKNTRMKHPKFDTTCHKGILLDKFIGAIMKLKNRPVKINLTLMVGFHVSFF